MFCGCRGLDLKFGRSDEIQNGMEIGTVRALATASSQITLLADPMKIGRAYPLQLLPIDEIRAVITTGVVAQALIEEFKLDGLQVEVGLGGRLTNDRFIYHEEKRNRDR
jgi:DeoR/GlpR family transcriptional regulator of sugar metabolism